MVSRVYHNHLQRFLVEGLGGEPALPNGIQGSIVQGCGTGLWLQKRRGTLPNWAFAQNGAAQLTFTASSKSTSTIHRSRADRITTTALGEHLHIGVAREDGQAREDHAEQVQRWVHFVGIGGSGLSALALVAARQGWKVTGSDLVDSEMLIGLREAGVIAHVGHSPDYIMAAACPDVVVVSSAVPWSNPEVAKAKELGIQICKRSEWLGLLTARYKLLAVAGSHGKTSTSAMLAIALRSLGKDVTAVIGGEVLQFPDEANALIGDSDVFVLESDEYDGAFLNLRPRMAVITNVEWEHVDIFPDEESVRRTFRTFVESVRPGGVLLICNENVGSKSLLDAYQDDRPALGREIFTYGLDPVCDFRAVDVHANSSGGTDFKATYCGRNLADVSLGFPGTHSVLNALAVLALVVLHTNQARPRSDHAILDTAVIRAARQAAQALSTFQGVKRRFEMVGEVQGVQVYDDYAHHPTEVRATLQAARQKFPKRDIWVVFQPHTYSRLAKLLPDFAPAFLEANRVIVTEVYSARETNTYGVSGKTLAAAIKGVRATFVADLNDVVRKLADDLRQRRAVGEDVVLLTLGAGDITEVGPHVLKMLRGRVPYTSAA